MCRATNFGDPRTTFARVRSRRLLCGVCSLVAWTLLCSAVGAAGQSAGAADEPDAVDGADAGSLEVVRYSAADPYALSLEIAEALLAASGREPDWVVLASGADLAEAVVAGPLASSLGAPTVLVPPGGLQAAAARADFVEFLRRSGAHRAMIVASADVLPNYEPSVLFDVGMLPRNVERIHGADRIGTALAVAQRMGAPATLGEHGRTVILASEESVVDAVTAGPLAAAGPFPQLLTSPEVLDERVAAYLVDHEIDHAVLVGGEAALAPAVQEAIESVGIAATRLAGRDRAETAELAVAVFNEAVADQQACAEGPTQLGFAPVQHPEQALTAGPLLARLCAPLRYVEPGGLPFDLRNSLYLASRRPPGLRLSIFGDRSMMPTTATDVSLPPTRVAFVKVARAAGGGGLRVEIGVVDERGDTEYFPQTATSIASWDENSPARFCWNHDLAWSPSGRYLSYRKDCEYDIHVLDTHSGDSYRIAYDTWELRYAGLTEADTYWSLYRAGPRWSTVEDRLAFAAVIDDPATEGTSHHAWGDLPRVHFSEIFVHDAATRSTRRLTHDASHDLVGTWSPDGSRLAVSWHSEPWAGDPYYRVGIPSDFMDAETGELSGNVFGHAWADTVEWSPDGAYIAFEGGDGWWTDQVVVMKSDGSDIRWLTPVGCEECYDEGGKHPGASILGWSPSGTRLAFSDSNYVSAVDELDFSTEEIVHYVFDVTTEETTTILGYTISDDERPPLYFGEWSLDSGSLFYAARGEMWTDARTLVSVSVGDGTQTPIGKLPILWTEQHDAIHAASHLSPDQHQLLLEYKGGWSEGIPGFWLTGIGASDLQRLVDFEQLATRTENGWLVPVSESFPERVFYRAWHWGCSVDWSTAGIRGACEYR